jgi:hypothetical protein
MESEDGAGFAVTGTVKATQEARASPGDGRCGCSRRWSAGPGIDRISRHEHDYTVSVRCAHATHTRKDINLPEKCC